LLRKLIVAIRSSATCWSWQASLSIVRAIYAVDPSVK